MGGASRETGAGADRHGGAGVDCVALVRSLRQGSGEVPRHAWPALGLYALLAGNYFTSFAVLDALQARETLALVLGAETRLTR